MRRSYFIGEDCSVASKVTLLSWLTLVIPRFEFYFRSYLIPDVGVTEDLFRSPAGAKSLLVEIEVNNLGMSSPRAAIRY